jgi:hypothetical protein
MKKFVEKLVAVVNKHPTKAAGLGAFGLFGIYHMVKNADSIKLTTKGIEKENFLDADIKTGKNTAKNNLNIELEGKIKLETGDNEAGNDINIGKKLKK